MKTKLNEELYKQDFITEYKKEKNPRVKIRYLGLSHIKEGKTQAEVSKILKVTDRTIRDWLRKYRLTGVNGLKEQKGRGLKQRLPNEKEDEFKKAVTALQRERKGGRCKALDIRNMLEEKFKVNYKTKGVYKLLKRLKMVWITGRSQHPKCDLEKQETFKKTLKKKQ